MTSDRPAGPESEALKQCRATSDPKHLALQRLRRWREEYDLRDELVRAARRHESTIAEIMDASGLAKNTVRAALQEPEDTEMSTSADLHHPHFISHIEEKNMWGTSSVTGFKIKPFTGLEQDPCDWYADQPRTQRTADLWKEVSALSDAWERAKTVREAGPLLRALSQEWEATQAALDGLTAAFDKLLETPAEMWPGQLIRLDAAQEAATTAARRWDQAMIEFVKLAGYNVSEIAAECGYDVSSWVWGPREDYDPFGPLQDKVGGDHLPYSGIIAAQNQQIEKVLGRYNGALGHR